ncbi:MAG TPA: FAD-binding domain-containing protein [Pyrinomonadaceae bacterium]|nr:deoxyribodipyrimidine photolyase [Acidobacteriota bacterium]HQZ96093.1 FAD-binding domain-containing protein [Pyrinomonadaceae bacterium]
MGRTQPEFTTDLATVLERVETVDPIRYARTRNFIDGDVTYLSPYISRGVISTKYVLKRTLARGFEPRKVEKFIQELAWREFYQRTWQVKEEMIDRDLRQPQEGVANSQIASSIVNAVTGIEAVDSAIKEFYETGYLHNHVRMYTAAIACNIGRSHWRTPARWMYYHLLDGDWASNAISWQWVAGTASSKKYFANQENINRYCHTRQTGTFLDVDYADFDSMNIPAELSETTSPVMTTYLPETKQLEIDKSIPTLIYNSYNLDPNWNADLTANRVLLLEPSHFLRYPVSSKVMDFILAVAQNVEGIQMFVGEFGDLLRNYGPADIRYKEHPLNGHYVGTEESRDWMFDVRGYFSSFFSFWKKCERQLN